MNSLLGVKIDAFASQQATGTAEVTSLRRARGLPPHAELNVDNFLVEVNGSGIREALRLILDLEFEKPQILLVEEPEVHLHPALEVAMMRYLKSVSTETQVFLTTHSTNFLDTGDMNNVYMVRSDPSTRVRHLDVADAEAELPKELGIRLSSIFMYDRLVFVEGVSDELVLRSMAETLDVNLSQANVGFVVMGGARNFTHYAAKATLSLLTRRQVHSIFVLDRDEQQQSQLDKLAKQLGECADLHVLTRREIENYLLEPSAISAYITSKHPPRSPCTPEEIQTALLEAADALKSLSVAKRVASIVCGVHRADRNEVLERWQDEGLVPVATGVLEQLEQQVADLRVNLSERIESVEKEIEARWEQEKLDLAPGFELLDSVMKKYGMRFKKDRDAGELAGFLVKAQIPAELARIIRQFASA